MDAIQPHSTYTRWMTPPGAPENGANVANSFCSRLCQDQLNKRLRCPVNCVTVRQDEYSRAFVECERQSGAARGV
jgi:hypothetical protein